jgi:hypothetical protein
VDPHPLLTPELAEFLESGLPSTMATRDDALQADGAWAWGVRVHPDRRRMTIYLRPESAEAMLANLRRHPEVALVIDRPLDHRACQVKGLFEASRMAGEEERPHVERQVEGVRTQLEVIGIPPAMTAAWSWWPCAALDIVMTHLFEQTPGPGAGEPLK